MSSIENIAELFETKVKALSEFCIIYCINTRTVINTLKNVSQNFRMVSRGGDALNYYFDDFFPTHDYDFAIVTISDRNLYLTQQEFNNRVWAVETVGKYLASQLTIYFENTVLHPDFKNLKFNFRWDNSSLSNVYFSYRLEDGKQRFNSLIDFYICDWVMTGVINPFINPPNQQVFNNPIWRHKLQSSGNITVDDVFNSLPPAVKNPTLTSTIFSNKIETVVIDDVTGINYIAPGDLFNDTVQMVYQSIYNITAGTNSKLVRYVKKFSKFIDTLNKNNICSGNTCNYIVDANILSRNTNKLDCRGNPLHDTEDFKNFIINRLRTNGWLNVTDLNMISTMSSKKLCEISYVLGIDF